MKKHEEIRTKKHALIIGIDKYQDPKITNLSFAKSDAQAVYDLLIDEQLGRIPPDNATLLLDSDATQQGIKIALDSKLRKRVTETDLVYIYFAGHGTYEMSAASSDGTEKYLVPADAKIDYIHATGISMNDIDNYFNRIPAKKILFIIDSCYSGSAGGRTVRNPRIQSRSPKLNNDFMEKLSGQAQCVFTACDANEIALESRDLGHGLFTHFLIEGLKGKADENDDGWVDHNELYQYVYKNVKRESERLDTSMKPKKSGTETGKIYLIQYEPPEIRKAKALMKPADSYYERGKRRNLRKARKIYEQVLKIKNIQNTVYEQRAREQIEQITEGLGYKETLDELRRFHRSLKDKKKLSDSDCTLSSRLISGIKRRQKWLLVLAASIVFGLTTGLVFLQVKNGKLEASIVEQKRLIADLKKAELQMRPNLLMASSLISVQGDTFEMGGSGEDQPVHTVIVDDFEISKYEVTNDQFCAYLNYVKTDTFDVSKWLDLDNDYCKIEERDARFVPKSGYGNHPVALVSWDGAKTFAKWLGCRLPTEIEWEYAARAGGSSIRYPNGNLLTHNDANFSGIQGLDRWEGTSPVGSFPANALGLYDMAGNLWEWSQNCYVQFAANLPIKPTAPGSEAFPVLRGGSWENSASNCQTTKRIPAKSEPFYLTGFRVVRSGLAHEL